MENMKISGKLIEELSKNPSIKCKICYRGNAKTEKNGNFYCEECVDRYGK